MQKLSIFRKELGLTQVELSAAASIPKYKIQLAEQGVMKLSIDEAKRLAAILGLNFKNLEPILKEEDSGI